jgi:hypothetical protein
MNLYEILEFFIVFRSICKHEIHYDIVKLN